MYRFKHVTNEEAIREYGLTAEEIKELEERADAYDRGEWPEDAVFTRVGRPSLDGEGDTKVITFRLPASRLERLDAKAGAKGQSRSEAFREAIDQWLEA